MITEENILWQYLDRCGINFRDTMKLLVSRFGSRHCPWAPKLFFCEITGNVPFLEGLAHPLVFQYLANDNLEKAPEKLHAYLRIFEHPEQNFSNAVQQLQSVFGEGSDSSVSNTLAMRWNFGLASVEARAFLKNSSVDQGTNRRHQSIPGSSTECAISIVPAWRDGSARADPSVLDTYQPIYSAPVGDHPEIVIGPLSFELPKDTILPGIGFGFNGDSTLFIQILGGRFINLLPVSRITCVAVDNLMPAKGGGGASLSLGYRADEEGDAELWLSLVYAPCKPKSLDKVAKQIAKRLNLPLRKTENMDC